MARPDVADPRFIEALATFAGSRDELEFERCGAGDWTYTLHGQVVHIEAETAHIRRTRTHAGEVHKMAIRYFVSATAPNGARFLNPTIAEWQRALRQRHVAREDAVARALADPAYRPPAAMLRSVFFGRKQGTLDGYAVERYVYRDIDDPNQRVGLIAKSLDAAAHFMAMQDIFLPLDSTLWHAIDARVLWPAGIALDKQMDPESWSIDWRALYDVLAGISAPVLAQYLQRVGSELGTAAPLSQDEVLLLHERGLLRYESPPRTMDETLGRISMGGLRQLVREAGSTFKARTRSALVDEIHRNMTTELQRRAAHFVRPPRLRFMPPLGLTVEAFGRAVAELRGSIFLMRQWLRQTEALYGESELRQLVDVV